MSEVPKPIPSQEDMRAQFNTLYTRRKFALKLFALPFAVSVAPLAYSIVDNTARIVPTEQKIAADFPLPSDELVYRAAATATAVREDVNRALDNRETQRAISLLTSQGATEANTVFDSKEKVEQARRDALPQDLKDRQEIDFKIGLVGAIATFLSSWALSWQATNVEIARRGIKDVDEFKYGNADKQRALYKRVKSPVGLIHLLFE